MPVNVLLNNFITDHEYLFLSAIEQALENISNEDKNNPKEVVKHIEERAKSVFSICEAEVLLQNNSKSPKVIIKRGRIRVIIVVSLESVQYKQKLDTEGIEQMLSGGIILFHLEIKDLKFELKKCLLDEMGRVTEIKELTMFSKTG